VTGDQNVPAGKVTLFTLEGAGNLSSIFIKIQAILSESGTSGSQVTGDQNVPAGKVTLFTLEGAPTLGSYDGFEHGPDGAPLPDRPIGAERNIYASSAHPC